MNPTSGTTYTYDGDGWRVKKSDGTVYWVDDQLRPVSVGTTSGSITRDYVFLGQQRIAFVPIATGNPYYYLSDHLGSAAVIASGDGKTIQWEGEFFPFGAQRTVITNIASNNYEFTGYEYDSDTGYNYAIARFDAGRWGRFLSPDPYFGSINIADPQSLNRYTYVVNSPINSTDPIGLQKSPQSAVNDSWGCTINGMMAPCTLAVGAIQSGAGAPCFGVCTNFMIGDGATPSGPDWVQPGRGDPELSGAGCLVNISYTSQLGDREWCPGWNGLLPFNWGGQTPFQITNTDSGDSMLIAHRSFHPIIPTMSAKTPISKQDAKALCLIAATNGANGLNGSSGTNPGLSIPNGWGVYTAARGTPKIGDESLNGEAVAGAGSGISMNLSYFGIYGGCMNSLGF